MQKSQYAKNQYAQNQYAIGAPPLEITSASLSDIDNSK